MSAQPQLPNSAPDLVNIEIDGKPMQVAKGSMIIHAADKAGIAIPRFCYHSKLSIAANCRMCLVEVEKMPKPAPACATPVMEGMKVQTQSQKALSSQRNVMEFLLINHPLDCPICDQGGECELQDLAMGYGRSVSRFAERKRVVADENIGPLVETEMTRCIHCTRCVRFMDEIAGTQEFGGMGRGEHLEIGTYLGRNINTELSGNIIDVCPVGALTNKVFRFKARPWELTARESIGLHDAIGSNTFLHTRRGEVLRTVPRDNDAINETWLSDRDRYSHEAMQAADRALQPQIKKNGTWHIVDWPEALAEAATVLADTVKAKGAEQLGFLLGGAQSTEDYFLTAQIASALGCSNIDHRLQQLDANHTAMPGLGAPLAEFERARSVLLIGSNPRHDAPILGHKVRKAWTRGAKISAINPYDYDFHFSLTNKINADAGQFTSHLMALAKAAAEFKGQPLPAEFGQFGLEQAISETHQQIVKSLIESQPARIVLGDFAARHPDASVIYALSRFVATTTGAILDVMPDGANSRGAFIAGALPGKSGLHARAMVENPRATYFLLGATDVEDFAQGTSAKAAFSSARVIACTAFANEAVKEFANIILPIALGAESEGTYVNAEGLVQRMIAGAKAPGLAQAPWRILRAIAELLQVSGITFSDFTELSTQIDQVLSKPPTALTALAQNASKPARRPAGTFCVSRLMPIYQSDAVVRRAPALQQTPLAAKPSASLHPEDALASGISNGATIRVNNQIMECAINARVPRGSIIIPSGFAQTNDMPSTGEFANVVKG
jgi:NADH-quinone oxidoreductase subunit G